MVTAGLRFNQVQPGLEPKEMAARYQATVDMAQYGEQHGFATVGFEEHHGADNGWSPSPLITAGLIFGRCPTIKVMLTALLVPLHDPLRIAEDIAVLDLASGGRFTFVAGIGYRPSEFAAHGKSWADRGRLMDEALETMLKAWTGEPFEYRGTTVRVTPKPLTEPHPPVIVGGNVKASARRAARLGLPLLPSSNLPELAEYYYAQCAERGTEGLCFLSGGKTEMLHVAEDPDKAWAELGRYFFHEASTYSAWQPPGQTSSVHSHATTVEELREEGIYVVRTPEECVAHARQLGDGARMSLHPLVGGMPIDEGWSSLQLFAEQVLPALA
jgi:alkanesulfonate monooxygenase SsuD/methylene tetrahydromethanopterin reductase-like flavin-dependent oxidoreductase (luciferase family)